MPAVASRLGAAMLLGAGLVLAMAGGGWWLDHRAEIIRQASAATGGDPGRALPIMRAHGCAGCHTIRGVPGAEGLVGPRLDGRLAEQVYIGGTLRNTPANMIKWLRGSREIDPRTAMPSTRMSEQEARDVAAWLYTLD